MLLYTCSRNTNNHTLEHELFGHKNHYALIEIEIQLLVIPFLFSQRLTGMVYLRIVFRSKVAQYFGKC